MTSYGEFWDQYITAASQREIRGWYDRSMYPTELHREIERGYVNRPEHNQPMDKQTYDHVLSQVKTYAHQSVAVYNSPDHNAVHFAEVAEAITHLFDAIYGADARSTSLLAVRQALEIAAWLHDCHHSGCTLRYDSIKPLYRPELGTDISVECVSAIAANEFLAQIGLSLPWRVFIANCILATTFAGKVATERGIHNIPVITTPTTLYHAVIRVADVWAKPDIWSELQKAINVHYHEVSATGKITDPIKLLSAQVGFQEYRLMGVRNLDKLAGKSITTAYQRECANWGRIFQAAIDGSRPDVLAYVTRLMS